MDKNKKLFPQRLWELIHDEKYNFCLRWSPDGQRVYLNRNHFETNYLKTPNNQFHTQKAISFVRQMNMYGFRKVDDCYYENDNFKRNCHHLLKNMVRRHSNKTFFSSSNSNSSSSSSNNNNNNTNNNNPHSHTNSHSNRQTTNSNRNNIISRNNNNSNHINLNQHRADLATSIPQHLFNHHAQQQQQSHGYQQRQSDINLASVGEARASIIDDIERQTSAATNVARCLRDSVGGSVGNIGAALAAINSSNNQATGTAAAAAAAGLVSTNRSPLPSTLYHRLAALNFYQSNSHANEQLLQQRQRTSENDPVTMAPPTPVTAATTATTPNFVQENIGNLNQGEIDAATNRALLQRAPLYEQQQFPFLNIPMNTQQQQQQQQSSLAARQASQQNLIRSFLQLKQPQVPLVIQQNLLASLQQQNPNALLLESLATLSSAIHVAQMNNQSSGGGGSTISPLELVVNPMPSSTSDNHEQHNSNRFQQLIAATNDNINPNSLMNFTEQSNLSLARGAIGECSQQFNNVNQNEDEELDQDDNDDCGDDFEDDLFSNNSSNRNISLLGNISLSSSSSSNHEPSRHCTQNLEDLNNTVLDLVKPSSARYNGRFTT